MLRHVVMLKMKEKADNNESRAKNREKLVGLLKGLKEIEVVVSMEIHENDVREGRNSDILLDLQVKNEEDLHTYINHEIHQNVLKFIGITVENLSVLDYNL